MIAFFRKLSQSWVARVLFAILAVAFVAYLPGQLHGKLSTDDVITAGPRTVGLQQFKTMMDNEKAGLEQQQTQGQVVPWEVLKQDGIVDKMVQDIANDQALSAWMKQIGLRPSDKVITDALQKTPQFFNPITGAFDRSEYDKFLYQKGVTEAQEEEELKDQVAREHFISAMRAGFTLPRIYGAVQAATLMQSRDLSWFVIGTKNVPTPEKPSDADLNKFIAINSDRTRIPELRVMTAVMFAPGAVAKSIEVSDADLQKAYAANKDKLSTPETRTFVVIPAKTQQAAAQAASSLKAGGDPAIVARAAGVSPVAFTDKAKANVPDEAVGAQAFAMQVGEVSQPVHGALGWAVIKVNSITPSKTVAFDEIKDKLKDQLIKPQVAAKIDDLVEKYQNLREKGVSMADAAKQLNLPIQTFPPFTKDGTQPNGQPYTDSSGKAFKLPKPMLDTLYSKPKGSETSEPEEAGNGLYYALHVDDVKPAHLPAVDDTNRAAITQAWMQYQIVTRAKALADTAAQRVRKGEDIAAVAKSVNSDLIVRPGETYPHQQGEPDAQIRATAFQTAPKDAFSIETQQGYVVGKTTAVHAPVTSIAASVTDMARQQMASTTFGSLGNQAYQSVRRKLKVKVDNTLVDQALSLTPPNAPKKK